MKIVQVNHMFLDGGGREEHIYQLSRRLAEMGHEVTIVTSDYTPTGRESIGDKARKVKGIFLKTLKGYPVNIPPGRIQIPDLMDYLLKSDDYDIIHAHGMGEQVALEAFYVAQIKGVPFVYTPHFHPYWAYEKLNAQKIWKVLQETQTRMIVEHADATIVFTSLGKKDLIKYTKVKKTDKIYIIPNGIDETLPKVKKSDIEKVFEKYEIPKNQNYMMFLGDPTNPRKGAFVAVQAFREVRLKLPDTHLIIVGPWGSRLKTSISLKRLTQLLNKLAKAGKVTITDWVSDFEKVAFLSGADLLISPTIYDSFGIALAEALYFKCPVVATKIGGVPDVVRDGIDGILIKKADDIKGFARACIRLLQNKTLAKKMGENGHKRVKKLFLWKKNAKKLVELYKRLIKRKNRK